MISVYPMSRSDIPQAVKCIQDAFEQDPYRNWVFDNAKFNPARNHSSLALKCEWAINGNALFEVAKDSENPEQVLGIAMWMNPKRLDQPQSWHDWAQDWQMWLKQLWLNIIHLGRGGLIAKRYWMWKAAQAECQAELWKGPYSPYFCNIITVSPKAQGKGVGKLLFQSVFDRADREQRQCYLESSPAKDNVKIYQKLGFKVAKKMALDDDGAKCELTCMIREPTTTSTN